MSKPTNFTCTFTLDLDGIFAANLYSTIGVESALDDLRKGGVKINVKFVGFDTSKKLVESVQAGKIDALVAQNPEKMGYLAVETLYKVVKKFMTLDSREGLTKYFARPAAVPSPRGRGPG